jgi:hypothetical protein
MSAVVLALAYLIRRSSADPQSRIHRFIGSYLTCLAAAGALSGSLGLYGLIDFLVEGDYLWFSFFMGASALALAFLRPRKQDLIDLSINSKRTD